MIKLRDWAYIAFFTLYSTLKHVWIQIVIVAAMFYAGMLVFQHYQGFDSLTALLASVSTITTIGLYSPNLVAIPNSEKVLLVLVIILSVGSAASLVQGTVTSAIRKEFLMEELGVFKAKRMKGHVIVMGYQFLGKYVTERLKEMGREFVVVVRDENQIPGLRAQNVITFGAPATHSFEVLAEAGIDRASSVVTTFDDDGDNMLAIMSAKRLNPNVRVVTIVNEKNLYENAKAAQADVVIAPSDIVGQILAASTVSKEVAGAFISKRLAGRGIAEFEITRAGAKIGDLDRVCPILLVMRNEQTLSSLSKDFALDKGDIIFALTDHESLVKLKNLIESG